MPKGDISMSTRQKKITILTLTLLLAPCFSAGAQQSGKIPRIGYLATDPQAPSGEAFRQGLKDRGYIEGQNIFIEWRFTHGKLGLIPDLAAELVRLKVDVIVTLPGVAEFKRATTTIPIVMLNYPGDPVTDEIVTSLARPGGNITGLTALTPELSGKRLELLKDTLPKLSRLAVTWNPSSGRAWQETQAVAKLLRLQVLSFEVRAAADLDKAIEGATRGRADALAVLRNPVTFALRKRVVTLAEKARLPGIYPSSEFVEDGGLMSYAASNITQFRRAATYVDKILKGTKPADLPVEQPTKFELVINLKTAKQIGLTIPQSVLFRADRVIK
jgi:putative ABC transport system substrate-binding protein